MFDADIARLDNDALDAEIRVVQKFHAELRFQVVFQRDAKALQAQQAVFGSTLPIPEGASEKYSRPFLFEGQQYELRISGALFHGLLNTGEEKRLRDTAMRLETLNDELQVREEKAQLASAIEVHLLVNQGLQLKQIFSDEVVAEFTRGCQYVGKLTFWQLVGEIRHSLRL